MTNRISSDLRHYSLKCEVAALGVQHIAQHVATCIFGTPCANVKGLHEAQGMPYVSIANFSKNTSTLQATRAITFFQHLKKRSKHVIFYILSRCVPFLGNSSARDLRIRRFTERTFQPPEHQNTLLPFLPSILCRCYFLLCWRLFFYSTPCTIFRKSWILP